MKEKEIVILNYQVWEGASTFLFNGRIMLGPQKARLLISFLLLNVPSLIFLGQILIVFLPS